jgi:hypothetical protein
LIPQTTTRHPTSNRPYGAFGFRNHRLQHDQLRCLAHRKNERIWFSFWFMEMHEGRSAGRKNSKSAVLLIPDVENEGDAPPYGIAPGYYNKEQLLTLLEKHKHDKPSVHFIADMLETGVEVEDGFANLLRANCHDSLAIDGIISECRKEP